jgi:Ca2+:H+ antiporter
MSLALWGVFVFVETVKHRDYFLDAPGSDCTNEPPHKSPSVPIALASLAALIISLVAVVLLAKVLSYPVDAGIAKAGLPKAFVGVVIAVIVLLPAPCISLSSLRSCSFRPCRKPGPPTS